MELEIVAKIILFICNQHKVNLKSDSDGKITLVKGEEEYCINDISEKQQVKIFRESKPDDADYSIIEQV